MTAPSDLFRYLPLQLRTYAKFPWDLFATWVVILLVITFLPLPRAPLPGASATVSDTKTSSLSGSGLLLSATGTDAFSLERTGDGLDVLGNGPLTGAKILEKDDGEKRDLRIVNMEGTTIAVAAIDSSAGNIVLSRPGTGITNIVKNNDDGFQILSPASETQFRIKIKDDKFNILDPQDARIFHGKQKNGEILVRDEGENDLRHMAFAKETSTDEQLRLASRLSVPISLELRLLLFAAALPKH